MQEGSWEGESEKSQRIRAFSEEIMSSSAELLTLSHFWTKPVFKWAVDNKKGQSFCILSFSYLILSSFGWKTKIIKCFNRIINIWVVINKMWQLLQNCKPLMNCEIQIIINARNTMQDYWDELVKSFEIILRILRWASELIREEKFPQKWPQQY